jgi:cellulose synthase/poly-beta-1,6-N-acetylglucosamine synthase-like glycosyltransferase
MTITTEDAGLDILVPLPRTHRRLGRMVVILPAYNEAEDITQAVHALWDQTRPPDMVVVSCDNCTDDTAALAAAAGAHVFTTEGNTHKRAGAVNQALEWLLESLEATDMVAMVDADTFLEPGFLERAEEMLADHDAVGPTFNVVPTWNLLEVLQGNEYVRYSRMVGRRQGRTLNLSGAAQVVRIATVRAVIEARRAHLLPGLPMMYNFDAISEDMELTIAVKTLGLRTVAPTGCRCVTDMMPTLHELWVQRIRWVQGGFGELARYGMTPVTRPMIWRKRLGVFNVAFTLAWVAYFVASVIVLGGQRFDYSAQPVWLAVLIFFSCERAFTARGAGWRGALLAALILPEFCYEIFRQVVFTTSLLRHRRGTEIRWS